MIYGNHNKRRGDIVKIARWHRNLDESYYGAKFVFKAVDYEQRQILLENLTDKGHPRIVVVNLDDTSLVRVGRLRDYK